MEGADSACFYVCVEDMLKSGTVVRMGLHATVADLRTHWVKKLREDGLDTSELAEGFFDCPFLFLGARTFEEGAFLFKEGGPFAACCKDCRVTAMCKLPARN